MYRFGTFFVFQGQFCPALHTTLGVADPCKMGNRRNSWLSNSNWGRMYRFVILVQLFFAKERCNSAHAKRQPKCPCSNF